MTLSDDEDIAKDNLNPFVCTLGEAAQRNAGRHHPFPTVYDLLEFQASQHPDDFAVGFPVVSSGDDGDSTPDCKLLRASSSSFFEKASLKAQQATEISSGLQI